MTIHKFIRVAIAISLVAYASSSARAQAPQGRPTYSPYLNLLRSGNPTFQNYYGLVRPQIQANQSIQSLQGQLQDTNAVIASNATDTSGNVLPVTGQGFGYMTHRGYFLNNLSSGSGSGARRLGNAGGYRRNPGGSGGSNSDVTRQNSGNGGNVGNGSNAGNPAIR